MKRSSKMLSDSLEHAFEDMDERAFAEACLKADEMLPAVETALRTAWRTKSPQEREEIRSLVAPDSRSDKRSFAVKSKDA